MTSLLLRAYHQMPAPMRSVAASLRGYYLHRWRYGGETEALVEVALERDRWSAERWREWVSYCPAELVRKGGCSP